MCVCICVEDSTRNRHGAYTCLDAVYIEENVFHCLSCLYNVVPFSRNLLFVAGLVVGAAVLA